MIKLIVFDLDDTLVAEIDYIKSGFLHVSRILCNIFNVNVEDIYMNLLNIFEKDAKCVFNRAFELYGLLLDENTLNFLVNEYRLHEPTIKLYDDVLPFIEKRRNEGIKFGMITDGYYQSQIKKIKAIKATNFIDEIILTDDLGDAFKKPSSKAFEMIRDKFGVEFNEMVYIGDNPKKDFLIGRSLGIFTYRIIRENGIYSKDEEYLDNVLENLRVSNLNEVNV